MEFLESLESMDPQAAGKLLKRIDLLEERGLQFMMTADYMDKFSFKHEDIYEIKVERRKVQYRILGVLRGPIMWLVHGFYKKSQATPKRHLETAKERAQKITNS